MFRKKIVDLTIDDLNYLIENRIQESRTIEYKSILRISSDKEKREFLADISSFANASGGDIIFGIEEQEGCPVRISEFQIENIDGFLQKIGNLLRDGLDPRLPSYDVHYINVNDNGYVIIIRVLRSWTAPHRVIFNSHDKFYTRSPNGKYSMDVSELRLAFTLSDSISQRISRFKDDRISKIIANETPIKIEDGAKIILHMIPIASFFPNHRFEYDFLKDNKMQIYLSPICSSGWNTRINLDGYYSFSPLNVQRQLKIPFVLPHEKIIP